MTTPPTSLHHATSAPHILVMDESRDVLDLLHEMLSEEGFSLTLSTRLLDLEAIRACRPALIVMERRFDGLLAPSWDVVRRTRLDCDLAHIPIVLSTTHRSNQASALMEQELQGRGVHVLLKPYALDDLLGIIQGCLTDVAERGTDGRRRLSGRRSRNVGFNQATTGGVDSQVHALLFPDGRVVVYNDPLWQLARWRLLGRIRQDGELLSFLRIDGAGTSWTALVPAISLEQETMPLSVPLCRQSDSPVEPLAGWTIFC